MEDPMPAKTAQMEVEDAVSAPPAVSPAAEVAALEYELRFGLLADSRAGQLELREAYERNNPTAVAAAQERLRLNVWRNNDIIVNQLPLARMRAAQAQADQRAAGEKGLPVMNTVELAEALDAAERELSQLTAEYAGLPGLLRDAANSADSSALVAHRRRLDEMPSLVMATQARVLRLHIAQFEAEGADLVLDQPAALAEMEAARVVLEKAQAAFVVTKSAFDALVGGERTARADASEYRLRLARLLEEQGVDRGPIVRSRIHAGRGLGDG
jgi:hypothetical protein